MVLYMSDIYPEQGRADDFPPERPLEQVDHDEVI